VNTKPLCANCGLTIKADNRSFTGWTHDGDWQGKRCPGMICGATPVTEAWIAMGGEVAKIPIAERNEP
jgi:hypothetical protein